MVTGSNPTYVSGSTHRPIPLATDVGIRPAHKPRPPKPTGLDWSKVGNGGQDTTVTPPPSRVCRECHLDTVGELQSGLCAVCADIATARFDTPTATYDGGPVDVVYDPQPEPNHQEVATVATPDFPQYIVDVAVVMRDTEGHPDPQVRAARKAVANAMVGLNKALTAVDPSSPAAAVPVNTAAAAPTRKGRGKLAGADLEEIARRYQAGESTTQLGNAFGVSGNAIGMRLRQLGVQLRPRGGQKRGQA